MLLSSQINVKINPHRNWVKYPLVTKGKGEVESCLCIFSFHFELNFKYLS